VLFVLFMALYMTVDGGKILNYLIVFFPLSRQPQASRVMTNIAVRLSHWVIGTERHGIFNVAEPSGYLLIERAQRELGWDPAFRASQSGATPA
jgi:hypothetical protein